MKKLIVFFMFISLLGLLGCSSSWKNNDRPAREIYVMDCDSDMPLSSLIMSQGNEKERFKLSASFSIVNWKSMQGLQDSHLYHPFQHGLSRIGEGVELLDPASAYDIAVFDTFENAQIAFSKREKILLENSEANHYIYLIGRVIIELPRFLTPEEATSYKKHFQKLINKRWEVVEGQNNASVLSGEKPISIEEMIVKKLEFISENVTDADQGKKEILHLRECVDAVVAGMDPEFSTNTSISRMNLVLASAEMLLSVAEE